MLAPPATEVERRPGRTHPPRMLLPSFTPRIRLVTGAALLGLAVLAVLPTARAEDAPGGDAPAASLS